MYVKNKQKSKTRGVPKPKNQYAKTKTSKFFAILKKLYIDMYVYTCMIYMYKHVKCFFFILVHYIFYNISTKWLKLTEYFLFYGL